MSGLVDEVKEIGDEKFYKLLNFFGGERFFFARKNEIYTLLGMLYEESMMPLDANQVDKYED